MHPSLYSARPATRIVCLAAAVLALMWPFRAPAADRVWSATAPTTTFNSGSNWTGGVAPANSLTADIAVFNTPTTTNQPRLTLLHSVAGVRFGSSAGSFTISSPPSATLLIGQSGILNESSAAQTISAPVSFGTLPGGPHPPVSVAGGAGGINLTGTVNLNGRAVTLTGNGTISGPLSGASGDLTKSGSGTWTLSNSNTFAGDTSVTGGTLLLAHSSALGSSTYTGGAGALSFGTLTSATLGGLSGSKNFALTNDSAGALALSVGANNASTSFSGTMSGSGRLIKTGSGTLTLTDVQTYTGTTTVNEGTLRLNHAGALATSTYAGGAGTLSFGLSSATLGGLSGSRDLALTNTSAGAVALTVGANGENTSYSGIMSGTGSLIKTGAGTLTLTNGQSYTGTTTVSQGTLALGQSNALANSTLVANGGTLSFGTLTSATFGGLSGSGALALTNGSSQAVTLTVGDNGANTTYSGSLDGSGSLTKSGAGTLTLSGNNNYSGTTTLSNGTLVLGSNGALGGSGNIDFVGNATLQFTAANTHDYASRLATSGGWDARLDTNGQNVTFADALTGAVTGRLFKEGNGTLTLSGANAHSGGTWVQEGAVSISADHNLGTYQPGATNLTLVGGSLQTTSSFTLAAGREILAIGGGIDTAAGTTLTFGGRIYSDTATYGMGSLTKSGAGTLVLNGNNEYVQFTIAAGTLEASGSGIGLDGSVKFTGGTLRTSESVNINGVDVASAGTVDTNGFNSSWSGISGSGSLTKVGAGTLSLDAANTFTGGITVDAGAVTVASGSGTGTVGGATVNTGGILNVASGAALGSSSAVNVNGGTLNLNNAAQTVSSLNGAGGNINLAVGHKLTVNTNTTDQFAGTLAGAGSLTKTGTGSLTLSGSNSYTGGTMLNAGMVEIASNTALGMGLLTLNGGTLAASGGPRTIANAFRLAADFTYADTDLLTITGAGTLTGFKTLTVEDGSKLKLTGAIGQSSTRILIKQGGGELELTGANTYRGGTLIDEGVVRINNTTGSAFGTGAVTVEAGATLTGSGSFSGALQLNGILSAGNSPGHMITGSQSWAAGAGLIWEIDDFLGTAGDSWDLISINGFLDIGATSSELFTIRLASLTLAHLSGAATNFDARMDYSFAFLHATLGIENFNASAFAIDTTGFLNPYNGTWSILQADNNLVLHYDTAHSGSPVPDSLPHGTLFACLGVVAMHWCRSRLRFA